MSEEVTPLGGDPPAVPPSESPRPAPEPVVRMALEEDTYWIRHLGLPFFYRHTPAKWILRVVFYAGLFVIVGLLVLNLALIPYWEGRYNADNASLMSQFFIVAIILSCILAPLLSTFSLCNERVMGTMEFLRLAPLSPTSIVLGKTFAPVYCLHLVSLGLLAVGFMVGTIGTSLWGDDAAPWTNLHDLCAGVVLILLNAVLVHALGAFLATLTTSLRGFASVIGLIVIGMALHLVPLAMIDDQGTKVLSFFSPWGLMDGFFWHSFGWWRRPIATQIFDREALAVPYLILMDLALSALLFRAAARRLDSPLRTALSPLGHMLLWLLLLTTCLGVGLNDFRWGRQATGWEAAAGLMGFGGAGFIAFSIFDHPHRREAILAAACERASAGREPPGMLRSLAHAAWVAMMTLLSTVVMAFCIAFSQSLRPCDWGWVAVLVGLPPVLSFLLCLLLEVTQIWFRSAAARGTASAVGSAVLATILIASAVDFAYTMEGWNDCFYVANRVLEKRGALYADPELVAKYPERFEVLSTPAELTAAQREHNQSPVVFFLMHHPLAAAVHLGLFVAFAAGLWFWRLRAYAGIRREAEQAVRGQAAPGQVVRLPHAPPAAGQTAG
jgi:ABC-type Na+ efflux pump permease subunit